jgi:hypothetical protein
VKETTAFAFKIVCCFLRVRRRRKMGEKMKMQMRLNVGVVQVCSVKTRAVRNGFDAKGI